MTAACGQENRFVAPPPPKVTVQLPVQQTVTPYLEATGNAAAVNTVKLVARVQGYLQEIKYQDGATVKKGTPLFVIEPEPYKVKLEQAQAAEEGAKAALVNAEAEFLRQQQLQAKDVSSSGQPRQGARQSRYRRAPTCCHAQANTQTAEINLGYTTVSAPFDGVVTARKVLVGELVGGDQPTELASIVQLNPIWVWFNVSERDVQEIRAAIGARGVTIADLKQGADRGRPADRERISAQGPDRLRRPERQSVDRHAAGARHFREYRWRPAAGLFRARARADGVRSRGCWSRRWRSAATRPAATS